jgi:hypothetical protein
MFIPLSFRPDTKASTPARSKPAQVLLGRASAARAAAARQRGLGFERGDGGDAAREGEAENGQNENLAHARLPLELI